MGTIFPPDRTTSLNFIEMPLNMAYKIKMNSMNLIFQAGPYVAYAVGGSLKVGDEKQDLTFGKQDGELNRFDIGLGIGTGIEINRMLIGFNFEAGFVNLYNNIHEGSTSKTQTGTIAVAYRVGKI